METRDDLARAAVEQIFYERKDFIIIGLTGRTGCGCSTVAKLLTKKFKDLQPPTDFETDTIPGREYKIIYDYANKAWAPFHLIEMKHIIFSFILENSYDDLTAYANNIAKDSVDISSFKKKYQELHRKRLKLKKDEEPISKSYSSKKTKTVEEIYNFYFEEIPKYYTDFQRAFDVEVYTKLLQNIGNNIRASGQAFSNTIDPSNILSLSQRVNMLIKILRRKNGKSVLVVIDAFRNPFEATFFKDRYSAFYLFAVNTTDDERRNRLIKLNFKLKDIEDLDKKEYPSLDKNTTNDFYKINIEKTIEIADIHIYNPDSDSKTYDEPKRQLIRYVSLIMHPGLVSPTPIEYCMQVAYDSKLKSGCISRQVGAVITDKDYNILSTGCNCAPENQIPCNLRSLLSLVRDDIVDNVGMSMFERTDEKYKEFLRNKVKGINFEALNGRNCAYCFKDAYNAHKQEKNQVHTRSIHAEEMAFLQSAKIGNPPVRGGYLFTTASPCELCSKKACQTGISKIYYIDKYPGISYEHVLNCGKDCPEMIPFHGAIGRAYTQLYTQILPYKDELYMLLGLTFKENKEKSSDNN